MTRDNERGIAMIVALFMVLAMSVIGTSVMYISQTETQSSHNYRLMSQARYGAESGVHKAVNYLLNTYVAPTAAADLAAFNTTVSPVTYNGDPVVLSSNPLVASHYPVPGTITDFGNFAKGSLSVNDTPVNFTSYATLKSMRQITDAFTGNLITIQSWEVTGDGSLSGAKDALVEVSSFVERQTTPIYSYAAFATYNGCAALSFAGGATTNSYDSQAALVGGLPALSNTFGNVGTNGNLTEVGNPTTINGSLSTPRTGVGACTENNITAESISGQASVTSGLNQLSQEIQFPTPPQPNPLPPTTVYDFKKMTGCPAGATYCASSANGATFTPPSASTVITMGDMVINAQAEIHFGAGTYVINSLTMNGNSKIIVDSGPVVFKIAGVGQATPLTITGQGITNSTFNPQSLQFVYGGTGELKLAGGDQTSALVYAPNATSSISGGADLYGAIVVKYLTATGGASIHYDRRLQTGGQTAGNYMMSAFNWKNY